jgi:glucose/arabinose dehydrogenase
VLNRPFFALRGWWLAGALAGGTLLVSEQAMAQAAESVEAQQAQAALQEQIDAADEQTREQLEELRRLERETRQLEADNASLTGRLAEEAERQQRLAIALDTLEETRAALPVIEQNMSVQLSQWIESDLPFLREERLARVERQPDEQGANTIERINGLLEAWRVELDYGREMDSWRGRLSQDGSEREVDFLRVGRIGFYYLTPDGREGGIWRAESRAWQPLDDEYLREVRNGLRMAEDQRAPELLTLPLSISANDQQGEQP